MIGFQGLSNIALNIMAYVCKTSQVFIEECCLISSNYVFRGKVVSVTFFKTEHAPDHLFSEALNGFN